MTSVTKATDSVLTLPERTQLPDIDGTFVFAKRAPCAQNLQEHPQSILLTDSIKR